MALPPTSSLPSKPYPAQWEEVADLRVFRTTAHEWEKLIGWRADMRKRGWKLLRVASEGGEMVAILPPSLATRSSLDRKSTRLNSSHITISYAVFCLKKKKKSNKS